MRRLHGVLAAFLIVALGIMAAPAALVGAAPTCNGLTATQWLTSPGTLDGTSGPDVLVGTNGNDTINGKEDNDVICGLGGDDTINGDAGDDTMFGDDGNDWITDTQGDNFADGGTGDDDIDVTGEAHGNGGNDPHVEAAESSAGAKNGLADGGAGNDGLTFGPSMQSGVVVTGGTADGGSGNDRVFALADGDTGLGGSGSDFVSGAAAGNQLIDCGSSYDFYLFTVGDTVRRCEGNFDPTND